MFKFCRYCSYISIQMSKMSCKKKYGEITHLVAHLVWTYQDWEQYWACLHWWLLEAIRWAHLRLFLQFHKFHVCLWVVLNRMPLRKPGVWYQHRPIHSRVLTKSCRRLLRQDRWTVSHDNHVEFLCLTHFSSRSAQKCLSDNEIKMFPNLVGKAL